MRFLIVLLMAVACRASSQIATIESAAKRELGEATSVQLNNSKTYALAVSRNAGGTVSYAVLRVSDAKVILKKIKITAEVTWNDEMQIKETAVAGIVRKNASSASVTIINLNDYLSSAP